MTTEDEGGLGPFDSETFYELGLDEYRTRCPVSTAGLSDKQIWDVVSASEDDMDNAEWDVKFTEITA